MKEINGLVSIVTLKSDSKTKLLFGKNVNLDKLMKSENLRSNGLLPYCDYRQLSEANFQLRSEKNISYVVTANINLCVAERLEECNLFKDEKSLVVICENDFHENLLIGPVAKGRISLAGVGSEITQNGFKTITDYATAMYMASEIARQAEAKTRIASFQLEYKL